MDQMAEIVRQLHKGEVIGPPLVIRQLARAEVISVNRTPRAVDERSTTEGL
jgi:hypothetical protein